MGDVKPDTAPCPMCLTHGRAMSPLQHTSSAYNMLVAGLHTNEQIEQFVTYSLVCWECLGFLKKMLKFQNQVLHANIMLQSYSDNMKNMSYSFLGQTSKVGFDYDMHHDPLDHDPDDMGWDVAVSSDPTLAQVKIELEASRAVEELSQADTVAPAKTERPAKKRTAKRKKKEQAQGKVGTVTLSESEMCRYREEDRESEQYTKATYKCESCIKGFIFADLLERHNLSKHALETNPYQCDICRECFISEDLASKHRRKHYSLYRCAECGYTGRLLADVERHYSTQHEPERFFTCDECELKFTTKRKLRYHKESAHKEAVKCELCGKVMINRYSLKHHMLTHTGMPTFECNICHKVYRGEAGLYSHMRLFHSTESAAETYCADCDIQFKNKTIYRSHLKRSPRHATPEQLKFPCEKCPKRFISEASLRKHDRYYHLDYTCHICQKRLKNWFSLDNHIKFVHEGREMPRKHMCETCGKGFKTKTMLNNHLTTHTGERPHSCDICGAAFSVKASLRTHRRHVHFKLAKQPQPATQLYHF